MKNRKFIVTIAIIVVVTGAMVLTGCHRHRSPEERIAHKFDHVASHLDLNEEQTVKLDAVKNEILRARNEVRNEHQGLFDEAIVQVQGNQLDQTKVLQLIDQHHNLMNQVAPQVVAKVAEFHATLTPEQKTKAVEQLERIRERMNKYEHGARM